MISTLTPERSPIGASESSGPWLDSMESLLDELENLAATDLPREDFHRGLLDRILVHLDSDRGAVWIREGRSLTLSVDLRMEDLEASTDSQLSEHRRRLLHRAATEREIHIVDFDRNSFGPLFQRHAPSSKLVVFPAVVDGEASAVVEIVVDDPRGEVTTERMSRFVAVVGQIMADYDRRRMNRDLRRAHSAANQFRELVLRCHGSLDLTQTAFTIANEARAYLGTDRVSILLRHADRWRIQAVSGVSHVERRAQSLRMLERLSHVSTLSGEVFWFAGDESTVPAELQAELRAYVDQSHVRSILILPIRPLRFSTSDDSTPDGESEIAIGAMVVETFAGVSGSDHRSRAAEVCRHAAVALANAQSYSRIPLRRLWQHALDVLPLRRRQRVAVAGACLLLAFAGMFAIPANHYVTAKGKLVPVNQQEVFAAVDGVVDRLHVKHGAVITRDAPLLQLKSPDIERKRHDLFGQIQATRKRLVAVKASRSDDRIARHPPTGRRNDLTGEEGALTQRLAGLEAEYEIVAAQQRELTIRSPVAGQVVTWDVEQRLIARPVKTGDRLLSVADVDGPWSLELYIPEKQAGHVLRAVRDGASRPSVRFTLDSATGQDCQGTLQSVATATRHQEAWGHHLLAKVSIDEARPPVLRPGAIARAKIMCGRRSLAFVWFHELIESVTAALFF